MSATLTLVVPGCCGPLPEKTAVLKYFDPALLKLPLWNDLSRAAKSSAADNFQQQLAALFAYPNDSNPFPYAALNLLGEGGAPATQVWLHADPVCMQADMDHAILFDAQSLQLADHEADQLLAELNAHFAQDGVALRRGSASHWYLSLTAHSEFVTSTLHDVVGRNVNQFLPTGSDAAHWKRFMNEAQMLLHASEVNQQREARGHLPVNSLWLWGEGRLSANASTVTSPFNLVLSNNASARGLARINNVDCESVPSDVTATIELLAQVDHPCLVLDDLFSSVSYGDVAVWQQQLSVLHDTWLQPLLRHAAKNHLPVHLYVCNGSSYQLRARDKFMIWRRGQLKTHLSLHA